MQALGEVVHLWQRSLRDNELCGCGEVFDECPFWSQVGDHAFGGWGAVDPDRVLALRDRVDRSRRLPHLMSPVLTRGWKRDLAEYVGYYERLYAAAREVSGASVVVDSSKQASLPHCLLSSEHVNLEVVHCIRDSRAVAYSWGKEVDRPESTTGEHQQMHRFSAGKAASYWMLHNAEIDVLAMRGRRPLRLRYEDWVLAPREALRQIRRQALLPNAQGNLRDASATFDLQPSHTCSGNPMRFRQGEITLRLDDSWRQAMQPQDVRTVTALTWPLLAAYGYLSPRRRHR